MEEWWKVILLGVGEGLTEFLPVSSTGHLLIVAQLLNFEGSVGGTFEIFIQLGAVLAVLGYYARDLLTQARKLPHSGAIRRFWLGIIVAFIPAAAVGILLHGWIKQVLFGSPAVIAWSLIGGGVILLLVERLPRRPLTAADITQVSLRQALGIGLAQVCALVPGISRSGATIVGGLLAGLDRPTATRFTFYLAIPTLGAATFFDLLKSLQHLGLEDLGRLGLGTMFAFVVGWISIGWLLRYVANHSFVVFGLYRIAAGATILVLLSIGLL